MYYFKHRRYTNLIFLLIIFFALLVLSVWLGYNAGLNASEGLETVTSKSNETVNGIDTYLTSISLAENVNMQKASGLATVDTSQGRVAIDIILPSNISLPAGSVLEGWLVDAGKNGGLGTSSVSEADQKYGTPFVNADFSASVDSAPYALSLGVLNWDQTHGSYHLFYRGNNNLTPYDAVMVTIEADGDGQNYDPRPGTPVLIGKIGDKAP